MSSATMQLFGLTWKADSEGWSADFQPEHPSGTELNIRPYLRIQCYDESSDDLAPISDQQRASIEYFLANQSAIWDEVLGQLLHYVHWLHEQNEGWCEGLDEVDSHQKVAELLGPLEVSVQRFATDGFAALAIGGSCDWEEEHGLGICLWKDLVLEIGYWDVMRGPSSDVCELTPLSDAAKETKRRQIIRNLYNAVFEEEEAADQAFQAKMPDSVHLATAIITGSQSDIQRLTDQGVTLQDYPQDIEPPIFLAIQAPDLAAAQKMIDCGARLDVKNRQRQTPLEAAQQMRTMLQMSQNLQQQALDDFAAILGGGTPADSGVVSMLENLQKDAAQLMTDMGGSSPASPIPSLHQRSGEHQERIGKIATQTDAAAEELEKIIALLESHG